MENSIRSAEKSWRNTHFTITPKLTEWGIFVECVKDLCTGDLGDTSGWMYWVNYPDEPIPGVAATDFRVKPGDRIIWYFSRSMSDNPDRSPYKIYINVGDDYKITVSMIWPSKVPPVADFTFSPSNPNAGDEVVFNASKSAGEIIDYIWNFGDGKSGRGMVVTHIYTDPGDYEVSLTVFDKDGLSDTITKTVRVGEAGIQLNNTGQVISIHPGEVKVIPSENVVNELSITALIFKSEKPVEIAISGCNIPPGVIYGTFYRWFEITANDSVTLRINFRVPKDIAEGGEVVLMKYNGSWSELPTEKTGEDENYIHYSAETTSLSVFAITVKWKNFPLSATDERIRKSLEWLKTIQNDDGGFANPEENSSISATAWAVMAIVAAGDNPHEWVRSKSPIEFIKERLKDELDKMGAEDYARIILALVYADEDPRNFAGIDLVSRLKSYMKENGQIGDFTYKTIWGIIALASVGENVSMSAEWLKSQQNADGGFSWSVGEESDFDDTAAAIQALIAAGEPKDSEVIKKALDYLKTGQNDDGGMRYFGNSASNAASDSWTIQALVAAGINPAEWVKNNKSVVDHLLSLQTEEGYFKYTKYQTSNPGYMTVSAIMALLGEPHPIKVNKSLAMPAPSETAEITETPTVTVTANTTVTETEAFKSTPGFSSIAVIAALALAAALRGRR